MKLNSEPGLVVLGSRINSDSRCKDAEVFNLGSIAIAKSIEPTAAKVQNLSLFGKGWLYSRTQH
ncbi:hypothetical protein QUA56_27515 [Microcoleus sp. N3A4]|uniref:hypothetical protein n=1 Tax=Microcoleus sp. N3A4 TaxID=3055379 RepID=UPI002FD19A12